ncbi:MAG: apolipoprotein N-acyltransferase [Proteobacteria bacterium]|nr:apolipoprotein N-acyltransferase [Pseudomonadota bacterium]
MQRWLQQRLPQHRLPQPLLLLERYPLTGHLITLASGALVAFSFAPFNWWPLGMLSVLVFLACIDGQSATRTMLRFYLYNLGMFGVGVSWLFVSINVYGGASPLLAGSLVAGFVMAWSLTGLLHGYLYTRFVARLPLGLLLGFPALWVLIEWFRSWFLTGFPWLFLGYGHLSSPLVGFAPVAGVLAVSFFVVVSVTLLYRFLQLRDFTYLYAVAAVWLSGFGLWQIEFVEVKDRISVVAVQGNIDQHIKWRRDSVMPILNTYTELTEEEWGADLIVWPEAAITLFREDAGWFLQELDRKGKQFGSTIVLGIPDRNAAGNFLNTAIAIGNGQGTYHKRRLVPFGEYVPLENWLRGIIAFFDLPMSHNSAGEMEQPAIRAGNFMLSLSICYEVVFPELVRSATPSPDLLVTISNDTWFGASIGPAQHLQMARMRAVENGRYLLRATNNGFTVLVSHKGKIVDSLPQFKSGVLRAEAIIMTGDTPYHRYGQSPVLFFCLFLLAGLVLVRVISATKN